ncbi:type II secretion system F family protein [Mitsuokella multacida]|uniref:Bacterial type II secretion system domain protein F n=1 Tax=Mitsuokella multacida DSM 20544 TaxID=500635 RepID=C9KLT7_9FIRM|nr:type II secretion system F family protein [Mitsuokella multacida]EEX69101.1 bacterial type II secretion system domain protein F [Mitsuokella multacida DSM 20544]
MKALLAILITVFCFALLLGLLSIRSREDRVMTERLNYFAGGEQAQRQKQKLTPKALLYNCIEGIANGLGRLQQGKRIELMMQQADWPIRGTEFEAILLLWGGLVGLVTFLVTLKGAMFFVGAFVGILMGFALLGLRIRRRRKKFTNQLGDMLTMVANALRAGFSFMQAFELISREMDAPMGREVQLVVNEVNLGNTLESALDNMQRRVASPDFELVVTAVLIQRQVGGDLASILDTISETIAERVRMRREVMTLTAQGRLSGIVLAILPFAMAGILTFIKPDYLKPLLEDEVGRIIIGIAIVSELIGIFFIKKITDIRY